MSYHVHIYRREVEALYKATKNPAFFEDTSQLPPFTAAQRKALTGQLEARGFVKKASRKSGARFEHAGWRAEALLTDSGLLFSGSGDAVFEILMLASELASKEFARFDPQEAAWE